MNRYYKANEEITLRFYQMPKVLFSNPRYKGLGLGAKAMYSILRDRQDLSIKNSWVDEENNIFLVFSIETLAELLDIDRKTFMRYKRELVKYELIIDKILVQGKSNRIYVLKPEIHTNVEIYERSNKGTLVILTLEILILLRQTVSQKRKIRNNLTDRLTLI